MASIMASAAFSLQTSFKGAALAVSESPVSSPASTAPLAIRCHHPEPRVPSQTSRRAVLASIAAISPALLSYQAFALLEADEDEELLEKVKRDRKSKIQQREALGSYKTQAASIQKAVYKLGFTGEALDASDFSKALVLLGTDMQSGWTKEIVEALDSMSKTAELKSVAGDFSSSLGRLQAAVLKDDVDASKAAYVASATSLEKWVNLTGLTGEIQGF